MGHSDNGGIRVPRNIMKVSANSWDIVFGRQLLGS
jgi:hypothetical protein